MGNDLHLAGRKVRVDRGISQRELDRIWESLGGKIIYKRRCGEGRYVAPDGKKSNPYHHDRKDASLKLLTFVRQTIQRASLGGLATQTGQYNAPVPVQPEDTQGSAQSVSPLSVKRAPNGEVDRG